MPDELTRYVYRTCNPKAEEYTFLPSAHGTFPRITYMLGHKTPIAKFRLKLKKVGKTTRSFRYDLNQIPYNYMVEVRNRFKGLDLIDRVLEELWMEVQEIEMQKSKMSV